VFLASNELLTVDPRLNSRVESAIDGEEVFFSPYGERNYARSSERRSTEGSIAAYERQSSDGCAAHRTLRLFR
jgi:hypothetical protein